MNLKRFLLFCIGTAQACVPQLASFENRVINNVCGTQNWDENRFVAYRNIEDGVDMTIKINSTCNRDMEHLEVAELLNKPITHNMAVVNSKKSTPNRTLDIVLDFYTHESNFQTKTSLSKIIIYTCLQNMQYKRKYPDSCIGEPSIKFYKRDTISISFSQDYQQISYDWPSVVSSSFSIVIGNGKPALRATLY